MQKNIKKKRIWLLLLLPMSILIIFLVKTNSSIAEYIFARSIYHYISQGLSYFSSLLPFSLAEILLYLIIVLAVFFPIRFLVKLAGAKKKRLIVLKHGLLNFLCIFSVFLFLFVMLCGTNYYRQDFAKIIGLDVGGSSEQDLIALCTSLAEKANTTREICDSQDENGVFKLHSLPYESKRAKMAMNALGSKYDVLKRYYGTPKPIQLSKYMSYTGITGIFIPFTMEANINKDIEDFNIPENMCHELAHMAGFMKEDEANFIAYLACVNSGFPEFVYSGIMSAFIYSANALYEENSQAWLEVYGGLSEEVLRDLEANREYWIGFEDSVVGKKTASVSAAVNNTYLKMNGQEDGVKSYGGMVDLLLAEYKEEL